MYEKFGQFIDGKWQQAEKKETYDVINPATEEVATKICCLLLALAYPIPVKAIFCS